MGYLQHAAAEADRTFRQFLFNRLADFTGKQNAGLAAGNLQNQRIVARWPCRKRSSRSRPENLHPGASFVNPFTRRELPEGNPTPRQLLE